MKSILWLTAAGMCALTIAPVAARPPSLPTNDIDREPNDDFASAVRVTPPLSHGGGCLASASDVDFYRFALTDPSPLFIGTHPKGAAQFTLTVYDGKHQQVAQGSDNVDVPNAEEGTYFLRISGMEKDCYDLQIFSESRVPPFG